MLGFLSANLIGFYFVYGTETPLSFFNITLDNDSASTPSDFVTEDQIQVYDDKIVINIEDASISEYAATGSMIPILDENTNGIRIIPDSESDIHIGDIITFTQDNMLIIHRVIEIGTDSEGTYFVTKGDNNSIDDGKIRFKDIKYITIGVIW